MAYEALCIPTNYYKQILSTFSTTGSGYKIKYFGISASGHDPNDPSIALAVDPSATVMPGGAPLFGPELIDEYKFQADYCAVYVARIEESEYIGDLSSIGLFAEVTAQLDPSDPPVGTQFLAAVYNRPLLSIISIDSPVFDCTIIF